MVYSGRVGSQYPNVVRALVVRVFDYCDDYTERKEFRYASTTLLRMHCDVLFLWRQDPADVMARDLRMCKDFSHVTVVQVTH